MSKKNFAILVFCLAFGVNALAFLFSKKTFHEVEDVKNVWIFELPTTASPLDAYSSIDMGPHQGVIGTLFLPNFANLPTPVQTELADKWSWNDQTKVLKVQLKPGLTYGDGTPILASQWVGATEYLQSQIKDSSWSPEWQAWAQAKISAPTDGELIFNFDSSKGAPSFDFQKMAEQVLTHPLTGVIHPQNLAQLKKGAKITKEWVSSGPYKIWKWNPKEIILASRNDFPVMLPKEFFRNVKFQSAPIKNPSCDFIQGNVSEEKTYTEHHFMPLKEELHVFWMCRSWLEKNTFCANPDDRAAFAKGLLDESSTATQTLVGKKVRYRIPEGSDSFRQILRDKIEQSVKRAGGTTEEVSYFFHNSTDADIELGFVITPKDENSKNAESFAKFSSRLGVPPAGVAVATAPNLVGQIANYPIGVLMKNMQGDVFDRVYLNPDNEDQKLPQ